MNIPDSQPPGVPPPPPGAPPPPDGSAFRRFFGVFFAATGCILLLLFGGCTGLCIISEGIPKRRSEIEFMEIGLVGTAIGAALLVFGLYLRRRR